MTMDCNNCVDSKKGLCNAFFDEAVHESRSAFPYPEADTTVRLEQRLGFIGCQLSETEVFAKYLVEKEQA